MDENEDDALLDELPQGLRNKVLETLVLRYERTQKPAEEEKEDTDPGIDYIKTRRGIRPVKPSDLKPGFLYTIRHSSTWYHIKFTMALIIGAMIALVGLAVCLTIIGIPLGIGIIGLSGYPLYRVIARKNSIL